MPTGSLSDSAEPPHEPEPPFDGSRPHSWLAKRGRHPLTWAAAGAVMLGATATAVLLNQPDGRARAQSVYCGLVTCSVLRSAATTSGLAAAAPHPAPSSPLAAPPLPAPAPARVPSPRPAARRPAAPVPSPAPIPTAAATPTPAATPTVTPTPAPTLTPGPPRWPFPPPWQPPGGWAMGGHFLSHRSRFGYSWSFWGRG
jgi:hypothetical protein